MNSNKIFTKCFLLNKTWSASGMRTEIDKKQGRPSEDSEEAPVKGAKRGKNSLGVGGEGAALYAPPMESRGRAQKKLTFLRFIIVKNAISLQEMQDIPDR